MAENNAAFDSCWWAADAYQELFEATGNTKWQRARTATIQSTVKAAPILNEAYLFKKDLSTAEPFSYPGTQLVMVNNSANHYVFRRGDGAIVAEVGNGSEPFPSAEFQNFAITASVSDSVSFEFEVASSVAQVIEIGVSTIQDPFDLSQTYRFYQPVPADESVMTAGAIAANEFIKWPTATVWHPTNAEFPIYQYSGSGGSVTLTPQIEIINTFKRLVYSITLNQSALNSYAGAGLVLFGASNKPPKVSIRVGSSDVIMRVKDSNGDDYDFALPVTAGAWLEFAPTWPEGSSPGQGPIQSVEFLTTKRKTVNLSIWWAGSPPETLPHPTLIYKTSITSRFNGAFEFVVGDVLANGSVVSTLRYNPGAVPFTVNMLDGVVDAWRGSLYAGYQNPASWLSWGYPGHAEQVLSCFLDSQDAYAQQNIDGVVGPFAPVFLWPIWSEGVFGSYNSWGWNGPDPNTEWCGYQYRALEAAAHAWSLDRISVKASTVTMRFLAYLDRLFKKNDSGQPPTNFPPQLKPSTLYHEPHAAALILRAAIYANLAGGSPTITYRVIRSTYQYILSRLETTGTMAGAFSNGQPSFQQSGQTYREYFGFWHGEIIEALALLKAQKPNLTYPPCAI